MSDSNSTVRSAKRNERAASMLAKDNFPLNALFLFLETITMVVRKMKEDGHRRNNVNDLMLKVNKMLHSILFFGYIHPTMYKPEDIFQRKVICDFIKAEFPEPFKRYQTHVPLQTPFSYFLEVVVMCYGQNEFYVKNKLSDILMNYKTLGTKQTPLISSVLCICKRDLCGYYGVSLACGNDISRNIMIAVSCVKVWHPSVSYAVMSVFQKNTERTANLHLPNGVTCEAYAVDNLEEVKPPCWTCNQLYSLPEPTQSKNLPGNCAETEAISKYFKDKNPVCRGNYMQTRDSSQQYKEELNRIIKYFEEEMKKLMEKRSEKNRSQYNINLSYN